MFKQRLLCSSIATVTALSGMQVAQAQDAAMVEEIVVTGVRASLEKAIDVKMENMQIVDSIVAEDIGKLPDNSVAEALQRVTGVQIARQNGEASTVLVRGLPDVVTTLNGRNIFTTTGRGIALADIPADLLQRVDVKKSASAADIEGGIAGVVDVHLRRPFDFDDGFTIAGGLRNVHSEQAGSNDPVGSVTMNNNWSSGNSNFGAMFSMSYQDRGYMDQVNFVTAPFAKEFTHPDSVEPPLADEPSLMPNVIGSYFRYGDRNRTSYNGAFQWSPNEDAEYYAEFFHVGYEQDSQLNFWVPIPDWGGPVGYVTEYKPGTNVVKEYVHEGAPGTITSNQAFANSSDTTQVAFGGKWNFDKLTVSSDLAYTTSEAASEGFILDLAFFAPRITYDFSKSGLASDVIIENADGTPYDLSDPSQYELWQFFDQRSRQEGEEITWKTDFNYMFDQGAITSVDFGLRLSQRSAFNQSADTGGVGNAAGRRVPLTEFPGLEDMTPSGFLSDVVSLNTSQWLTPNREYLLANRAEIREAMGHEPLPGGPEFNPAQFFDDEENNYAAYVAANYETELGGMVLDGQLGARLVRLDATVRGTTAQAADGEETVFQDIDKDISETRLLPSVSARLALSDDLYLRGAASQTVTRPGFADLNPATAYFQPTPTRPTRGWGSGGNSDLDTVESRNYDVSLEWYFDQSSSLTAGIFYRDIDGYIQHYASEETLDGAPYSITRPQNTDNGSLEGVELAYTQFFDNLPGFWSGFGIQANATFMDGEAESPPDAEGNTEMQNLQNVSDESYNLILLYEKYGFSARLAYNWRSDYYLNFNADGAQPGNSVIVTDTDSLDLALNYDLNDNLTLSAEATNLTDSVYSDYFGGDSSADESLYPRDTFARERTYSLGVRFRY